LLIEENGDNRKGWFGLGFLVFNATFNNILVRPISVLLVEEIRVPGENHRHVANHSQI
jgi:hypothetical protein